MSTPNIHRSRWAQCYPLQTAAQGCAGSPTRQNLTGARAVQAPEWKLSVGADYSPSLGGNLRGVAQVNWQYQSSVYYVAEDPQTFQPAYGIVNAGLGVRDGDHRWEVVAFVNNVFDKQYYPALVNSAGNFGQQHRDAGAVAARLPPLWRRAPRGELLTRRRGRTPPPPRIRPSRQEQVPACS
ncbi:MAG: TonB-dependent receptor [Sphingomonas sp.]